MCHLGLGDHIICNGMVMELLNRYREIVLPVKHHNNSSVSRMFSGLSVSTLPVSSDEEARASADLYEKWEWEVIRTGIFGDGFLDGTNNFALSFYQQADVDFDCSWSSFRLHRDPQLEEGLFNKLGAPMRYIFVHDDPSRGLSIDVDLINSELPILRPDKSLGSTISEYSSVLENAEEIHCIDSSFANLVDRINLTQTKKIVIHRYSRLLSEDGNQESLPTHYKKNWKKTESVDGTLVNKKNKQTIVKKRGEKKTQSSP